MVEGKEALEPLWEALPRACFDGPGLTSPYRIGQKQGGLFMGFPHFPLGKFFSSPFENIVNSTGPPPENPRNLSHSEPFPVPEPENKFLFFC